MGLGIIALGLWLLLGIQFHYNEISLFPEIVAFMVLVYGLCSVLKKTRQKEFIIALVFLGIEIIITIFFKEYSLWIFIILLYFIFIGIDKISNNYPKIKNYQKQYKTYLICLLCLQILTNLYTMTLENNFIIIISILLIFSFIIFCMLEYHIIKINHFIEDEFIDLEIVSLNTHKNLFIILILTCISIGVLIYVKNDFIHQIQLEVNEKEVHYFKVDQDDYKIAPFGYKTKRRTTIQGQEIYMESSGIEIYIKNELLTDSLKVKYTITYGDDIILQNYNNFQEKEYADESFFYGHAPFIGYTGGTIASDFYQDAGILKNYISTDNTKTMLLTIELYDKNEHCYYRDSCDIEPVEPTTYYYEDEDISIKNFQYDMNALVSFPEIDIKTRNQNIGFICIYYHDSYYEDDPLIFDLRFSPDTQTFYPITEQRFIHTPISKFQSLRVVYYDHNGKIIKETICDMEEQP